MRERERERGARAREQQKTTEAESRSGAHQRIAYESSAAPVARIFRIFVFLFASLLSLLLVARVAAACWSCTMPQNEHIELFQKRFGHRLDYFEKKRKKEARLVRVNAKKAHTLRGIKAKIFNKKRYNEKAQLKKTCVSRRLLVVVVVALTRCAQQYQAA